MLRNSVTDWLESHLGTAVDDAGIQVANRDRLLLDGIFSTYGGSNAFAKDPILETFYIWPCRSG